MHVVGPDGQPINGATVDPSGYLYDSGTLLGTSLQWNINDFNKPPTDTNGNGHLWLFDHTAATGANKLRVTPPAGSGLAAALVAIPTITGNTTINVTLVRSFRFAGVVRDGPGPSRPQRVDLVLRLGTQSLLAVQWSFGRRRFIRARGASRHLLIVSLSGSSATGNVPRLWNANTGKPGKVRHLGRPRPRHRLAPRDITVHVVGPDGQPINGATVETSGYLYDSGTLLGTSFQWNINDFNKPPTDTNGNGHLWLFDHTAATGANKLRVTPPAGSGLAAALGRHPHHHRQHHHQRSVQVRRLHRRRVESERGGVRSHVAGGDRVRPRRSGCRTSQGSSVAVSGVALASADFVLGTDVCSGKAVAVGAACTFQASFRPASVGTKSANVVITDNGPWESADRRC